MSCEDQAPPSDCETLRATHVTSDHYRQQRLPSHPDYSHLLVSRSEGKFKPSIPTLDDYHSIAHVVRMSSSPRTPSHSRNPSNIESSAATPFSYDRQTLRRNSKASVNSPISPRRQSLIRSNSIEPDGFGSTGTGADAGGLGNLADELADAWDDDEGEGEDEELDMNFQNAPTPDVQHPRDSGVDVAPSPARQSPLKTMSLTPPAIRGHRRKESVYDGSDYGEDSDDDSAGIPLGLQSRMDLVESLARRGTENNGSENDGVVRRVVEGLKDLGGQSGVEGGATRYVSLCSRQCHAGMADICP